VFIKYFSKGEYPGTVKDYKSWIPQWSPNPQKCDMDTANYTDPFGKVYQWKCNNSCKDLFGECTCQTVPPECIVKKLDDKYSYFQCGNDLFKNPYRNECTGRNTPDGCMDTGFQFQDVCDLVSGGPNLSTYFYDTKSQNVTGCQSNCPTCQGQCWNPNTRPQWAHTCCPNTQTAKPCECSDGVDSTWTTPVGQGIKTLCKNKGFSGADYMQHTWPMTTCDDSCEGKLEECDKGDPFSLGCYTGSSAVTGNYPVITPIASRDKGVFDPTKVACDSSVCQGQGTCHLLYSDGDGKASFTPKRVCYCNPGVESCGGDY